ncbi:MAG: DNA polymerase III subunit delta [Erysipelothrix sp.]|nr:DNA polymerase III subunit delta [Erysipelothrix sp.]
MNSLNLLKTKQSVVYTILNNALESDKLAHAYLFSGIKGSLQQETALLLVQSLFCEQSKWACGQCVICNRIKNNVYPDMIVLDGSLGSIKKADVLDLQHRFALTSLEKYVYKIFIIKDAHHMTNGAANSLLKFLEEPSANVLGILISDQTEALLPTVISRCQVINFKRLSYLDNFEIAKLNNIADLEAYYYSKVVFNHLSVSDFIEHEAFQLFQITFERFIDLFDTKPDMALYSIHNILLKHKDKEVVRVGFDLFINMLIVFYGDTITQSQKVNEWYDLSVERHKKGVNSNQLLEVILETKNKINPSINNALLVDQMVYNLKEVM